MFQWDAVDTSPDLWGQNVLKAFELAARPTTRTTRSELESFLSLDLFSLTFKNTFLLDLLGGGSNRSHRLRYGSATGQIDRTEVLVPTEKTRLVCGSRYVHLPLGTRQDQPHPSALFLRLYHCRCCAVFENTYFSFFFRFKKNVCNVFFN